MKGFYPSVSLLAIASWFYFQTPEQASVQPSVTEGYIIGEQAEDFRLKNYDGRMVSLSDYKKARGYIIVFTSNHCPYAEAYEDRLIRLHHRFAPLGYPVIAINPNAPSEHEEDNWVGIRKRALEKKFPFPYLSDSLQQVFPRFGADRTPHVFILDSLHQVRYMGTIDDNAEAAHKVTKRYVEWAIEALMRGEQPNPSSTKAVGCRIRLASPDSSQVDSSGKK